jgi:hypothetical protein
MGLRMSKTSTLIPIEEYLHTSYHPDREYVDGDIQERNLGEKDHSKLQKPLPWRHTADT